MKSVRVLIPTTLLLPRWRDGSRRSTSEIYEVRGFVDESVSNQATRVANLRICAKAPKAAACTRAFAQQEPELPPQPAILRGNRNARNALMVEQTWLAIAASLLMGAGAIVVFIYAAKRDYFQDLEEAKYQVFWSDLEELVDSGKPGTEGPGRKKEQEQEGEA